MTLGRVSCNTSIEGFPSGSLVYEGILKQDLPRFKSIYARIYSGQKINVDLKGVALIVSSFEYERYVEVIKQEQYEFYRVTVGLRSDVETALQKPISKAELQGSGRVTLSRIVRGRGVSYSGSNIVLAETDEERKKLENASLTSILADKSRIVRSFLSYRTGVKLARLGGGKTWTFGDERIVDEGAQLFSRLPIIKRADLQGNFDENSDFIEEQELRIYYYYPIQFNLQEPEIETSVEGDLNPHLPPDKGDRLFTPDSNSVDGSGPKKVWREIKTIGGKPFRTKTKLYGYRYSAKDINLESGSNGAAYWGVIEQRKINYIYDNISNLNLNVKAVDPATNIPFNLVLHPDYVGIADVDVLGSQFSIRSTARYLTQILTVGYRYARFEPETSSNLESIALAEEPTAILYNFFKIPLEKRTHFSLKSFRSEISEQNLPFNIDWTRYEELEPRIKAYVGFDAVSYSGLVGVVTPDINYVEPLYIVRQQEVAIATKRIINPNDIEDVDQSFLMTGEETRTEIIRTPIDQNTYKEKVSTFSAENGSFEDVTEEIKFKTLSGKMPEAQTVNATWTQEKSTERREFVFTDQVNTKKNYLVSSDLVNIGAPQLDSVSAGSARTIREARSYLASDLRIRGWSEATATKTIAWWEPNIKCGDRLKFEGDFFYDSWRVTNVSWELEYCGTNNRFDELLVLCQGTQLTLGYDKPRSVSIRSEDVEEEQRPDNLALPDAQPKLLIQSPVTEIDLGDIITSIPSRRQY